MLFLFCFSVSKTNAQCSWAASTVYPIGIMDQGMATVGTNLYSFGGVNNGAVIATSYRFDGATWTAIASLPAPAEGPAVATDGVNVYIIGGYNGSVLTNTLVRYNVATNTYTSLAPAPVTAWAHTAVFLNGIIYRFGGQINLFGGTTTAVHAYNIATNTWSTVAPYAAGRSFIGGFAFGNFVYAMGGIDAAASLKTYQYDPVANSWSDAGMADLPGARWGSAVGIYNGFGIMAGGYAPTTPSNTAIIWDPVGNAWSTLPNMLTDRARFAGGVQGANFHAVGGRCTAAACSGFQGTNINQMLTCNFTPCSGTPNPGATTSTANPVCPTIPFTLGITTAQGTGSTHQWQSSPTGAPGTWTNIAGATGSTFTTSITTMTWFRDSVRCTASGQFANSTPLQININPPAACYCTPTYSAGCTFGDYIARVRLNTLDNASLCSTPPFTYYSAVPATTILTGITHTLSVNVGPDIFGQWVGAWIDYNIDGVFQTSEFLATPINAGANGQANLVFTVPATATLGTTRLRIRGGDDLAMNSAQSCGASNSPWGEAEDYNVTIAPCVQGVFTTQPTNQAGQCSGNVTFTSAATGSLLNFQWEYRVSSTSPWLLLNNGGTNPTVSGATTAVVTLSSLPTSWNNYQFRVVMSGPCTAPDFSNVATLTVGPLVATVTPTSANICNGQIQQLRLTNVPVTVSQTFNSGPISVPIPDNNTAGISHTQSVTIPTGSAITAAVVTFSIPNHTWPGDLVVVIRDPNNNILNLDYYISGTGAGPGNGMVNTRISSAGGPLLSSVPPSTQYTGTFRADARTTPGAGLGPVSPTGFTGTVVGTWTPLTSWSGGTGNWTIAVYDGFGLDIGTLTNWQLELTYGAAATGVWTANPSSPNTMFTDPAATVPYVAGSQASTIYVRPSVNTTYCVTYSTSSPACTSAPTCIPVNVFNPVTNLTVTPSNPEVCVGNNTTFTATSLGGPMTWQWQVSVNGGVTWTNIAGATGPTLPINSVTPAQNNNLYRVITSVTACADTDTSNVTRLTVNLLPKVTISSPTLQLVPGRQTTITASSDTLVSPTRYTWFLNGAQILGANTNSVIATIDRLGNYQVSVRDTNGCVGVSNVLVIGGEASDRLWIYPNPTNDGRFQVRLFYDGSKMERRKIFIYTADGRKVAEKWFDLTNTSSPYMQMDFDLSYLPNGTYVVKVNEQYMLAQDDDVKKTTSGLLIIQR